MTQQQKIALIVAASLIGFMLAVLLVTELNARDRMLGELGRRVWDLEKPAREADLRAAMVSRHMAEPDKAEVQA